MIIILALFFTTVFAQNEKYMELLPDEEKPEFLEKVPRRIMESVETNVTNIHSKEQTDEQLKEHNSYVQNVLKQEAEAFEVQRHQEHVKNNEDIDKINYLEKTTLDLEIVESTTKIKNIEIKNTNNSLSTILKKYSQRETLSETDISLSVTATNFIQKVDYVTAETTTGNKSQILDNDTAKNSNLFHLTTKQDNKLKHAVNHFEPSSNATESYTQDSSNSTLTNFLIDESTIDSVIDTAIDENLNLPAFVNTTTTKNIAEVNSATTEGYKAVTEDRSAKERLQTVTETITFTPILTTSNNEKEQSTKTPKIIKLTNATRQPNNNNLVRYVASKALKKIKHELELKEANKIIDNKIETTKKGNTLLHHYRVYEIPWLIKRNNLQSRRSKDPIKDQPYFVPVYKYLPKFAYYNPQNRLGPNEVADNAIALDKQLRERNNEIHYKARSSQFVLQLNNALRKFGKFKRKKTTTESPFPTQTVLEELKKIDTELERRKQIFQILINFSIQFITNFFKPYTNTNLYESSDSCESMDKESSGCNTSIEGGNDSKKKGRIINKTLRNTDKKEYYDILNKLEAVIHPLMRSKVESKVNLCMKVLKDLILNDSKGLKQHDRLPRTEQIQTALSEILKLIKRMRQSEQLYPADLQLLRYMVFLNDLSLKVKKENNKLGYKLRKKVKLLPKRTLHNASANVSNVIRNTAQVNKATTENYNAVIKRLSKKGSLENTKKKKAGLKLKKKKKIINNKIETPNKRNTNLNHYQVYEIPWPIKRKNQLFPRNEQLNIDKRKFIHLFRWTTTTTTTTTTIAPAWDLLKIPFKNRQTKRTTTTIAPKNMPYKSCDICESTDMDTSNEGWNRADILSASYEIEGSKAKELPLMRSQAESKVNIYLNVLKDLILEDSKSLRQYDWLTTTVQIQLALSKILNLIKRMKQSEQLYAADLQLLRYMVFLHNFSLEVKNENNKQGDKLSKKVKLLPKKSSLKSFINRVWPYLTLQPDLVEDDELSHLNEFLIDVQDGLFNLHEAMKHIADVTKFDRQNWYSNLKQLYLSPDVKQLRELLLHISMSRLIELVEHSCKQGLNHDFGQFVETNRKDAESIVEEMIFINDVVHDIIINNG